MTLEKRFWWTWIGTNAAAEALGLGLVAGGALALFGEALPPLARAGAMIALGGVEGLIVGLAQRAVLQRHGLRLNGWVAATVAGALCAWVLGMLPSTLMHLHGSASAPAGPMPGMALRLLLAAGLGLLTGPVLAAFQWRCLRQVPGAQGWRWLAANALGWALAMPVIFALAHAAAQAQGPLLWLAGASGLGLAGALASAVHGRVLLPLLPGLPKYP
ncbi:hypothetical protein [Massilia sp. TS11]|uniref:hypothetical protein n=1 Tax=Massilia sp. TS11 TaxID=2908003 RepID=UPI001EDC4B8C|nr:hypothetical protein [Massilia sp. TS11]MCG2584934.1 hypothetical protein [Massilia sp. TS11]